jgi:hypothetical protein
MAYGKHTVYISAYVTLLLVVYVPRPHPTQEGWGATPCLWVTKESFLSMVETTSDGGDFLKIINLLPDSSQLYGHSLTMNAIIKIISRHTTFKDRCTGFYTTKIKSGKEMKVASTYNTLNQSNKELL